MADEDAASKRVVGLTKVFNAVISGRRDLKIASDANRFLEALCVQEDARKCVEQLIAAPNALGAIAKAFRFDANATFINGPATSAIHYLSHSSVKQLCAGQLLYRVLEQIVEPPIFWDTFVESHNASNLTPAGTHAFAWLLLELLHYRSEDIPDVRDIAPSVTENESLLKFEALEVRNLGCKIKHLFDSTSAESVDGPGGRHDKDFADFRKIKILPTTGEFESTEHPFYRRANEVHTVEADNCGLMHLDNQFAYFVKTLLESCAAISRLQQVRRKEGAESFLRT
jgi:hypothetical protein